LQDQCPARHSIHGSSPSHDLLLGELRASICQSIDSLPVRLREVSRRFFLEDNGYEGIAEDLGISNANVRKRIQEARLLLRQVLSPYLLAEPVQIPDHAIKESQRRRRGVAVGKSRPPGGGAGGPPMASRA
jgi:hypothetical protein